MSLSGAISFTQSEILIFKPLADSYFNKEITAKDTMKSFKTKEDWNRFKQYLDLRLNAIEASQALDTTRKNKDMLTQRIVEQEKQKDISRSKATDSVVNKLTVANTVSTNKK